MISLTESPIDTESLLAKCRQPQAGAILLFLGITRQFTAGKETAKLDYDCYAKMATRELEKLEHEARSRWELVDCAIVHRLGEVPLTEASVAIAVSSAHRADAFEAGRWLIDQLKDRSRYGSEKHGRMALRNGSTRLATWSSPRPPACQTQSHPRATLS